MTHHPRSSHAKALSNALRIALVMTASACGEPPQGYAVPTDEAGGPTEPAGTFSDLDLSIVRSQLGSLPAMPPESPTNRFADGARAALLGQRFFFEKSYSSNGEVSCATCHIPSAGFGDNRSNTSEGLEFTTRSAPTIVNAAYGAGVPGRTVWQFWDGRKDSLWSQALGPPENPSEMRSSRTAVAAMIFEKYRTDYEAIFGAMPDPAAPDVTADELTQVYVNFGKAIEAYERLVVSRGSAFDRFRDEVVAGNEDSNELNTSEKLGLKVFVGKGGCISCHRGPNFSDWQFHNIGISQAEVPHVPERDTGREGGIESLENDEFNCVSPWSDQADKSACAVASIATREADTGAFKTPTLRNVALTGPYFHTGAFESLEAVIDFYDHGGEDSGYVGSQDRNIRSLGLSAEEKRGLVDFLGALTGEPVESTLTRAPD